MYPWAGPWVGPTALQEGVGFTPKFEFHSAPNLPSSFSWAGGWDPPQKPPLETSLCWAVTPERLNHACVQTLCSCLGNRAVRDTFLRTKAREILSMLSETEHTRRLARRRLVQINTQKRLLNQGEESCAEALSGRTRMVDVNWRWEAGNLWLQLGLGVGQPGRPLKPQILLRKISIVVTSGAWCTKGLKWLVNVLPTEVQSSQICGMGTGNQTRCGHNSRMED